MLRSIKSHRGAQTKEFIGVIGNYYVEILDDDPFIRKILSASKSHYHHEPSKNSRFLAPYERMVLKSHENNSLVIFKSECIHEPNTCSIRLFIHNHQKQTREELLTDALRLASFRWSKIMSGNKLLPLGKAFTQPAAEILEALSSLKNL